MKKLLFLILIFLPNILYAKNNYFKTIRLVSYNVENLFDTLHDKGKTDQAFLPKGSYRWTYSKQCHKQANIARTLSAINGWNPPAIVALLEIENRNVLEDLVKKSPLKNLRYQFLHQESPDRRGIDVALLYQPKQYKPVSTHFITVDNQNKPTRDILYSVGLLPNKDTLHVFVAHLPSRYGGQSVSEAGRIAVTKLLRHFSDSILSQTPTANIVIMGDFNDYPDDRSLSVFRNPAVEKIQPTELYNLMAVHSDSTIGTHKYQNHWGILDHIIVSGNLLLNNRTKATAAQIFAPNFLLEEDKTYGGVRPFRTHIGMKYHGGYSDHLPVFVDFFLK